jgi:pimeloyl-ACP methyl ester carboxylesterase
MSSLHVAASLTPLAARSSRRAALRTGVGLAALATTGFAPEPTAAQAGTPVLGGTITTREHRVPSVSAKDGSQLTLTVTEKHLAETDPSAMAAQGRVVLLTHGSSYSGQTGLDVQVPGLPVEQSWSLLDQLALRGYNAWTLAYQNYGHSDRHDCGLCVTTEVAAQDVESVAAFIRAERGAERLHLIAWSWGAQAGGLLAQMHPEWVDRLVLNAPILDRQEDEPPTEQFRTNTEEGLSRAFHPTARVPEVVEAFLQAALASDPTPRMGCSSTGGPTRARWTRAGWRCRRSSSMAPTMSSRRHPGRTSTRFSATWRRPRSSSCSSPRVGTRSSWSGTGRAGTRRCWPTSSRRRPCPRPRP